MKRIISFLICIIFLIVSLPMSAFAIMTNPIVQIHRAGGGTVSYNSFSSAVNAAMDGDTVTIASELLNLTVSEGVTVTKNIFFETGKFFGNSVKKYIQYNGTSVPLFTVADGATLTVTNADIFGNSNNSVLCGGFVYIKKGGTLVLNGNAGNEVLIKNFCLNSQNSKGGAIYCEQGGTVKVNGVTFTNNFAKNGVDIYAEQKTDVLLNGDISANFEYGESVNINAQNLLLSGEIGLVFRTFVPEKYINGFFRLTSRYGDNVIYEISKCEKDNLGRYLAEYKLSAIELSEPVTLSVLDVNGDEITSKTTSAEEYGKALFNDSSITESKKNIVKKILNFGHFAQIDCSEINGWKIGQDYAQTEQYGNLSTEKSVFDKYKIKYSGFDSNILKMNIQLSFGYKTDIKLYFPMTEKPTVKLNGEEIEVENFKSKGYNYGITIKGISALDLEKEYTVTVNNSVKVKLCVLSYCRLAVKQSNENTVNSIKALYEFFNASVEYNQKAEPTE